MKAEEQELAEQMRNEALTTLREWQQSRHTSMVTQKQNRAHNRRQAWQSCQSCQSETFEMGTETPKDKDEQETARIPKNINGTKGSM